MEYDDSVFETITTEDMEMENNWTITYNQEAGPKDGNFLISNIVSGIKTEQTIGKIIFKIREDVKPQETVIRFKEVKSNDGGNLVPETDKEIRIKIIANQEIPSPSPSPVVPTPTIPQTTPTPNPTPKASPEVVLPFINNTPKATPTPMDVLPGKLPQTGINSTLIVIIVLATVNAVIVLIRYKKMDI